MGKSFELAPCVIRMRNSYRVFENLRVGENCADIHHVNVHEQTDTRTEVMRRGFQHFLLLCGFQQ